MDDASVSIIWGTPCILDAQFVLFSQESGPKLTEIGFPVGAYSPKDGDEAEQQNRAVMRRLFAEGYKPDYQEQPALRKVGLDEIQVGLNGDPVEVFEKWPFPEIYEQRSTTATWYYFSALLQPGKNTISIHTHLQPSDVYCMTRKRVSYCIWTGGRWSGPIGHESVRLKFQDVISKDLICRVHPDSAKVNGKELVWDFQKIEPSGGEYDIDVEMLEPQAAKALEISREKFKKDPRDWQAGISLAQELFGLGMVKGNASFPPESLSPAEYLWLNTHITEKSERTRFQRFYRDDHHGRYFNATTEWTEDRVAMVQILADAGFCCEFEGVESVLEARQILEQILKDHPNEADAWSAYLANFWRFSFAAVGGPLPYESSFTRPQRVAIRSAFAHCPNDPRIKFWYVKMLHNLPVSFQEIPVVGGKVSSQRTQPSDP